MTKYLKHLKTFELHSTKMYQFFFRSMLFGGCSTFSVLKFNVKVERSSRHISQNFNIGIKHGFSCIIVRKVSWYLGRRLNPMATVWWIKMGNLISQSNMDMVLRPAVLPFLYQNQCL